MWVYLHSLTMSASNSGRGPGGLEQRRPTNLPIFSSWSLILFSRRHRDFTPYIGRWSTEHYQQSIQNCCFYILDTRSPYLCDLDCIKPPSFLQTHHVQLGAIYFDSRVNHVWLQSWYLEKISERNCRLRATANKRLAEKALNRYIIISIWLNFAGLVPSSFIKLLDISPASSGTMEILFYD